MKKGLKILMCVLLAVLFVLLFGYITMSLWNWLVPDIFGVRQVTFWEALGLFLLAKILFGGVWGKGGGHCGHNRKWNYRYYEKFSKMTPEERERFKEKFKEKWCSSGSSSASNSDTSVGG